jgi:hypothetical protein
MSTALRLSKTIYTTAFEAMLYGRRLRIASLRGVRQHISGLGPSIPNITDREKCFSSVLSFARYWTVGCLYRMFSELGTGGLLLLGLWLRLLTFLGIGF